MNAKRTTKKVFDTFKRLVGEKEKQQQATSKQEVTESFNNQIS